MKKSFKVLGIYTAFALALALVFTGCKASTAQTKTGTNAAVVSGGVQTITTKFSSREYAPITVQKGIPVEWTIQMDKADLNGCNKEMIVQEYGIEQKLSAGEIVIKFTPTESGTFPYSCWMGMIDSKITVVDNASSKADILNKNASVLAAAPVSATKPADETVPAQVKAETKLLEVPAPTQKANPSFCGTPQSNSVLGMQVAKTQADKTKSIVSVASIEGNKAYAAIKVTNNGYEPPVVIVQKGVSTDFIFDSGSVRSCALEVSFPQIDDYIDLSENNTVTVTPESDFLVQCSMGMYGLSVVAVDDIGNADVQNIEKEILENPGEYVYASEGGSCCAVQ